MLRIPKIAVLALALPIFASGQQPLAPHLDISQPFDVRARDLVSRLTLDEKASLMGVASPGLARFGIPPYDWWNEAAHGVARAGTATVFPQAIGLAATWDDTLMHAVADAVGTEARVKYNEAVRKGSRARFYGLTFWSPDVNIFRDPRWGRGQETYGEDPFLTSRMGVAFVRGLQGDDPRYFKAAACAKFFAVHSGPEQPGHDFNADPDERDLHDTYLPAFEALVREAHVAGIMTACNSVRGRPCAINGQLYGLLYGDWGFDGYVVSDFGGIHDLCTAGKAAPDEASAAAMAVKAGLCLDWGGETSALAEAVRRGLLPEADLDARLRQLLLVQYRLGFYDPRRGIPYSKIPVSENDSPAHAALALDAARKSIVLLKNNGLLPLSLESLHRVAVVGPNADSEAALLANPHGTPSSSVTVLAGIRAALGTAVRVDYARGCDYAGNAPDRAQLAQVLKLAKSSDLVIFVGGLTSDLEGRREGAPDGPEAGDRTRIELPEAQERCLEALYATGTPVVFVLMSGGAVAIPWADAHVDSILEAWYPGQAGGTAVADVLLGRVNPSGRLPVTFYSGTADLPPFGDYRMAHRTYRYFAGTPLYPFGHGLSYTHFEYSQAKVDVLPPGSPARLNVSVTITNDGSQDGDEIVQVYAREPASANAPATESLCAFQRVHVAQGESVFVNMQVGAAAFRRWNPAAHDYAVPAGYWKIRIGASSADIRDVVAAEID